MHARMTTFQTDPGHIDEVVRHFREEVLPVARQQAGYEGGHFMIDRETGKVIAVSLWTSEEAMRSSAGMASQTVGGWQQRLNLATAPEVEGFEVAASEMQG